MERKIVLLPLAWSALTCSPGTKATAARADTTATRSAGALGPASAISADTPDGRPLVVFFGTSLTAGLGLNLDQAYPALIQAKLDSAHLPYRVVNAGVSGATSADGLERVDWVLKQGVAVFVLELGANDALRGQDLRATRRNLQAILDHVRAQRPTARIIVAGMQAPPNLGRPYGEAFRGMFVDLSRANHASLIPFLLAGVAGVDSLNNADGLHPNAAGSRRVAQNVWDVLVPVLKACRAGAHACAAPTS
jgi:acyl-CoA thioesterase-1